MTPNECVKNVATEKDLKSFVSLIPQPDLVKPVNKNNKCLEF